MEFKDIVLKCADCKTDFIFTADEQLFFSEKQFVNPPKRCKVCRLKRTTIRTARHISSKRETVATCASCGKETTLPFLPRQARPVFCRECFAKKTKND